MTLENALAAALFAFALSATPGPNNVMLTASGARFGLRRTVPHLLGVTAGFGALTAAVALGLGGLFEHYPAVHTALRWIGAAYLLYLAWRIATADPAGHGARARPIRFTEAFAFQFANPKVWVMGMTAVALFTAPGDGYALSAAVVIAICMAINLPCVSLWACFGTAIGRWLGSLRARRRFQWVMGGLTAACVGLVAF
ncbi:hypothetical protein KBTX_03751 [wastewater metagenome]|uniref:Cysteine/O-acetylserine efflux protein n=3 Tax=root TaxID=1 RepID=A0A5B8RFJ2_9ZZZZ|nr:LysE family translocator [Arhodomonas aquaeolei]QEA07401.1 hypothetical protein KBTEX_03751 [uncultured organism]